MWVLQVKHETHVQEFIDGQHSNSFDFSSSGTALGPDHFEPQVDEKDLDIIWFVTQLMSSSCQKTVNK